MAKTGELQDTGGLELLRRCLLCQGGRLYAAQLNGVIRAIRERDDIRSQEGKRRIARTIQAADLGMKLRCTYGGMEWA